MEGKHRYNILKSLYSYFLFERFPSKPAWFGTSNLKIMIVKFVTVPF